MEDTAEIISQNDGGAEIAVRHAELQELTQSPRRRSLEAVAIAALGGVPWVGGFAAAASGLQQQKESIERDLLLEHWIASHEERLGEFRRTLEFMNEAFDRLGDDIDARLQSNEYLSLVRRAFGAWDHAETDEKRRYVANLLSNAAGYTLTSDDVLRLFIDWIDEYHEIHFAVIRAIHARPGLTRAGIWSNIKPGTRPREDSADADLFRLLIDDLSRGRVLRQHREKTLGGDFLAKTRAKPSPRGASPVMKSAFDDEQGYELTALGAQFVHYTMNETVARLT